MRFSNVTMIAVSAAVLGGCGTAAPPTAFTGPAAPKPTRITLMAVDRSGSTEEIRDRLLTTAFNIGTNFDAQRDTLRLYRFGNSCEEVYSALPSDDDAFAMVLVEQVKKTDPVPGTDYPRLFEALADAAESAPEQECLIVVCGDGLNDFRGDKGFEARYRAAAERIARNPKIRWVRVWGAATEAREELRSVFGPLGARFQILSLDQNPLAP